MAPDLVGVVRRIVVAPNGVEVTIGNQGTTPVPHGWGSEFWVNVHADPASIQTEVSVPPAADPRTADDAS